MARSTYLFRLYGIPIRVHITLWFILPLFALNLTVQQGFLGFLWGVIAAVGLFASVALHELGHSVVAISKGCHVREILLLPIGGIAQLTQMPSKPADEIKIAIAGPAVSLALSLLFGIFSFLASVIGFSGLFWTLSILSGINLMLALFNLLPSFPMDGGRVFRAWMTPKLGRLEATRRAAKIGRIMAVIFGIYGLFSGQIMLIAIAVFIYLAAGAEYRMVQAKEAYSHYTNPWTHAHRPTPEVQDDEIYVSPPPYADAANKSSGSSMFDDLFKQWHR